MAIERPVGSGKKEKASLDSAAKHILEECRMVLPGIQAVMAPAAIHRQWAQRAPAIRARSR